MKERNTTTQVKEGDEVELEIISIGSKGDGMGKVNGFCIFVPQTNKGRAYQVKITKVLERFGFGEALQEI